MGKIEEDTNVHGVTLGMTILGIAWCVWQFDHPFISVILGCLGIFLVIGCCILAVKEA